MEEEKKKTKTNLIQRIKLLIKNIPAFLAEVLFMLRFMVLLFFVFIKYLLDRAPNRKLNKPNRKTLLELSGFAKFYAIPYSKVLSKLDFAKENDIRASDLILLAMKNLSAKKNRTYITIGGMAIGFGAVVLLLSVGYGFERLVVSRVASLSEMKQVDVNISQGSPLALNKDVIEQIGSIKGVDTTLPIITSVSKITYNKAVSDVIVYGVTPRYLEETGINNYRGEIFQEGNIENISEDKIERGVVAGVSSTIISTEAFDTEISNIHYSIEPLIWKAVYEKPNVGSSIIGYTKREVGKQDGLEVWGSAVEGSTLPFAMDINGNKYLPWVSDSFPVWQKEDCSLKNPDCIDSKYLIMRNSEGQVIKEGYITQDNVSVERYQIREGGSMELYQGKIIDNVSFEIPSGNNTKIYFDAKEDAISSSISAEQQESFFKGDLILGDYYEADSTFYVKDTSGKRYGYWIKGTFRVWQDSRCENLCEIYYTKERDNFVSKNLLVYIKASEVNVGSVFKGDVLGESNTQDVNGSFIELNDLKSKDEGTDWVSILSEVGAIKEIEKDIKKFPESAQKQVVVNTAMINLLGIKESEAVGEKFEAVIIFDSKLFDKTNYLVESEPVELEILGVVADSRSPTYYICYEDLWVEGLKNISQLKVILTEKDFVSSVRENIESIGFKTSSIVDTVDRIGNLFGTLRIALLVLGLIALGVASLGMFNTLTVSLLEKTREVGLLKTMGLKSREVKILFLAESIIMSVLGSISGLILGLIVGKLIGVIISIFALAQGQDFIDVTFIPVALSISLVSLSFVVGIITGWYPAKRATDISALNALRYE